MHHLDRFTGPWVLPLIDDLAGRGVEIHHDLARDRTIAVATYRVFVALALTRIDADDVEDVTIFFTGDTAVHPTFPHAETGHALFGRAARGFHIPHQGLGAFAHCGRTQKIVGGERDGGHAQ